MNSKIWLIVGREYRQFVAKRSFWIGLLLGPLFFAALFAIQILSVKLSPEELKTIAIVDRSGSLAGPVASDLENQKFKSGKPEFVVEIVSPMADTAAQVAELNRRVADKSLYGFLTIDADVDAKEAFRFHTRNVGGATAIEKIDDAVDRSVIGYRLQRESIAMTRERLEEITKNVRIETFKVSDEGEASKRNFGGAYIAAVMFSLILLMTILAYGVTALRGILEEKSSRIIEVLLSSVTPFELLMGKVVGFCLVGLTQVGAYAIVGTVMSLFGIASDTTGLAGQVMASFTPGMMGFFLLYYLLGVFLFMSMFVAVGSMVNTEQEAQSLQQPIMWMLIIPIYATFFFINNPDSMLARVVSLIPFFTPMVMLMRISVLTPPAWEILLSVVLTFVTILAVIWVVSRIFRIGILMYGKKPSLPEIVKWVKAG